MQKKSTKNGFTASMTLNELYDPSVNIKAISIRQDEDGNWTGTINKNGKIIEVRGGDPTTVLAMLITSDGT